MSPVPETLRNAPSLGALAAVVRAACLPSLAMYSFFKDLSLALNWILRFFSAGILTILVICLEYASQVLSLARQGDLGEAA